MPATESLVAATQVVGIEWLTSIGSHRMAYDQRRAALYDALHRGVDGDIQFYLTACAEAESILELGCGSGRIAAALAIAGHRVVGLDIEPELLTLAKTRQRQLAASAQTKLDYRSADIRAFELGTRFDRVILTHSTLYALPDDASVAAMLSCAKAHLAPDGILILDAYAADPFHAELDPDADDVSEQIATIEALGQSWRVFERSDWNQASQQLVAHYRYLNELDEEVKIDIQHRYLLEDQIHELVTQSGFHPPLIAGDFRGGAYDPEQSEILVVIAQPDTQSHDS